MVQSNIWVSATAALLAAVLALFTLFHNRDNKLNRACFGLFACLTASHLGWILTPTPSALVAWLMAESWLPALMLRFGRYINRGGGTGGAVFLWAEKVAIGMALTASGIALLAPQWLVRIDINGTLLMPPLAKWGALLTVMLFVAALLQLENLFRATNGEVRWRLKYLLVGCAAIIIIRIYILTLATLFDGVAMSVGLDLAVGTLVGGGMVTYAVVRHRLLDVDVFVSRYVIYNSITVVAVGSYLLIVGLMVWGLNQFADNSSAVLITTLVFLALIALGIALLSDSVKWRVRHFVDRNFYKNRHDYRHEWQAVTHAVAAEHSIAGFVLALTQMIKQTLGVKYVVTLLEEGRPGHFVAPEGTDEGTDLSPLIGTDLDEDPDPRWGSLDHRVGVHRHRTRHDQVLFLPLQTGDQHIGWVALGPRVGHIPYHMEDLELVCAMAAQTAVGVRNLQLGEALAESREQAALHQLSTFFIHDMKNTTNSLGLLAQNIRKNQGNPEFWADAETGITQAVAQMNTLAERLRELRKKAPIETSPIDLDASLRHWAKAWRPTTDAGIVVETDGRLICMGNAHLLESVFTNLVINAAEAGASHIRISGARHMTTLQISVEDNGGGMTSTFIDRELFKPFSSTKPLGMGIGLFQSRRVIEQLEGRLGVTSTKGSGSCFTITLPADSADPPGTVNRREGFS